MPFCQWNVNTNCLFKNCFCWSEVYSLHGECFVFPWRCPPSSIIIYISHYCPTSDSLCHLRHWNNRPWLTFWEAWLLLIGLMADKWLCKKRYGLLQDKKKKKRIEIESWPPSVISSVIFSILMSIKFMDYLAVFCSLAQLALSDRSLGAMARW